MTTDEEFKAADRPMLRGTAEWSHREYQRQARGAACITPHSIPMNQAHGEKDAKKQQMQLSAAKRAQYLIEIAAERASRK